MDELKELQPKKVDLAKKTKIQGGVLDGEKEKGKKGGRERERGREEEEKTEKGKDRGHK